MILSQRQKQTIDWLGKRGIIWWKIGEGKTRIALAWALNQGKIPLIICSPNAVRQWLDEMELVGVRRLLEPIFVSSGILGTFKEDDELIFDYQSIDCLIIDELWMFKNLRSKRSHLIRQLSKRVPTLGLSGSIMTAGNLEDLYGQTRALWLDHLIANNLTDFRSRYMIEVGNQGGNGYFVRRFPKKEAIAQIQNKLRHFVDIYFPEEKKEIRDIPVSVDPTIEQERIRKKLVTTYMYEDLEIKTASALLVKLQQVSDGFLRTDERKYLSVSSTKLARLKELCTEFIDNGERFLIWVGFRKTAEILSQTLNFKTSILSGDGKFNVEDWKRGKTIATIATVGSGASLNDFAHIRYAIFYSTTFNSLSVQQARGRTNRKSSLHSCCYYYFLSTDKFPDKRIYKMIDDNKAKEEIIIETAREVLGR